ncbi:MAG TPA: hypothetical protein ENO24_03265 [Chloroflexi bacterium]|nr:hypothetical protein [Chloroflexota bacterium]
MVQYTCSCSNRGEADATLRVSL